MTILREIDSGKDHTISMPCLIGRGKDADLFLNDQTISHRHALIDKNDDRMWIMDLQSANGVWVNRQKITSRTVLQPGDFIQLGTVRLLIPATEDEEKTVILHSVDRSSVPLELDRRRLELIYAITSEFPGSQNVARLAEKLFARFKDYFHQDHASIVLFRKDGEMQPLCSDSSNDVPSLSRSILNRVSCNGESLLLEDALSADSFKEEESIIALRVRSAMCAPLIYHNQINGLIYIDRNIPGAYGQSDLELFCSIAAIIAPLIENAKLWSKQKKKYFNTVDKLRETEARLIDTERVAAYVRLSQAMAHEMRNPLVSLGGLIRRVAKSAVASAEEKKFATIIQSVERIEKVLQEVDSFAQLGLAKKKLIKIDNLVQGVLESYKMKWQDKQIQPRLLVKTSQVMAPVDGNLIKKALSMVIQEILLGTVKESELLITIQDADDGLEICFGRKEETHSFKDPFAPVFLDKPWCNSLFLNIAHKILLDHGGKLLLNTEGRAVLPLLLLISRSIHVETR